jgi:type II secretory pathway component PulF
MPHYRYTALDGQGIEQSGAVEAETPRAAADRLRAQGLYVLEIAEDGAAAPGIGGDLLAQLRELLPVRIYDLVFFFQQMALMLRSGLTLLQALETARTIARNGRLAAALGRVGEAVRSGERFSEALGRERVFPTLAVQLVKSAESSGELDEVLDRIAQDLERRADLRRNLGTGLIYPAIVVVTAIGVMVFLLTGIIPKLAAFLQHRGKALPPATQRLLELSDFLTRWGWLIGLVLAAGSLMLAVGYQRPRGRLLIDRALLRIPKVGSSLAIASVTQLCWSLAMLLRSGVTVLESLRVTAAVVPNQAIAQALETAQSSILGGHDVASSLANPLIPKLVSQMAAVGERTGALDAVMQGLGDYYQRELALRVKQMTAMIEPTLIFMVGGMVGYVYYAFFQAVYSLAG